MADGGPARSKEEREGERGARSETRVLLGGCGIQTAADSLLGGSWSWDEEEAEDVGSGRALALGRKGRALRS